MKKTKLCWECGRKLYQNKGIMIQVDGLPRLVHKQCAEQRKKENHPCYFCEYKNEPRDAYPCSVCEAF